MTTRQSSFPQNSKSALNTLLSNCLNESLKTEGYPSWTINPIDSVDEIITTEFTMLTVSSYDFRIFVILHSNDDTPTMQYASDALNVDLSQLSAATHRDFIGELGNRFCGAFKRHLGPCFPHMGMSTPNRLHNESLKHLKNLSFSYDTHVGACSGNGSARFYASLFISLYDKANFSLDSLSKAEEQVEVGALELF